MQEGRQSSPVKVQSVLGQARSHAARMGELVMQASHIANTVLAGWHGRRQQGPGESFWQFRPYAAGEAASRIDWRRSARDHHTYIRDRERDAAQTVFLCPDLSASMRYQSRAGRHSKEMRAVLLTLILAEILARRGERVALPGLLPPTNGRNAAQRVALALAGSRDTDTLAHSAQISRHAEVIVISDFLDPMQETEQQLAKLAGQHVRAHLVEVADPAELLFPFSGHIVFRDPENGAQFSAGRAQSYRDDYRRLFEARRQALATLCRHYGWSFTISMTDRPLSETLHCLHTVMQAHAGHRWGALR